jgi:hypothetical protein
LKFGGLPISRLFTEMMNTLEMIFSINAPASPAAMVRSEAGSALFVGGVADAVAALWRRGRSCGGVLPVSFGSL